MGDALLSRKLTRRTMAEVDARPPFPSDHPLLPGKTESTQELSGN